MNHSTEQMEVIRNQARDWVLELSSGDAVGDDLRRFQAWIESDPLNGRAFNESQRVWEGLAEMPADDAVLSAKAILDRHSDKPTRTGLGRWLTERLRPAIWAGGTVVAAVLAAAVLLPVLFDSQSASRSELMATGTAEIRDVELADGSVVTLGAKSTVVVDFDQHQRRVQLVGGEAFFAVTKDAGRPFVVVSGGTEVRVLGTQFDVRQGVEQVRIAVLEGIVEVTAEQSSAATARLTAGQQVKVLAAGEMTPVGPVTGDLPGDWRSGRLFYEGESLREIIADANRYHDETILLTPHSLGKLKVTASFHIERIDQMLNTLQLALPIEVSRLDNGSTILIKQAVGQ